LVPARGEHAPSCPLAGGGDDWHMGLVGCYRARPGQVSFLSFLISVLFSIIYYLPLFCKFKRIQNNAKYSLTIF
uniref:hypothetical protein n=1 Tax=Stenotrophomonas maltophilia TaxID=40324 RepID=UPI001953898F